MWGSAKDVICKELEELPRAAKRVPRRFCPSKLGVKGTSRGEHISDLGRKNACPTIT